MSQLAIVQGLMERGLPYHVALGIAGNMAVESGYRTDINEIAPLVEGSRGGFGLNQWTGPRRRALEAAAQARGVPVDDLGFQLDYTIEELYGPERNAFNALRQTQTPEEAARVYSEQFLRPGIPHMDRRIAETNALAGMMPNQPQQQNALAAPQLTTNALDPRDFMSRRRFS